MKILVIDDEILIRNVIKEYCLNSGYVVDEATDGIEGLKKLLATNYDLMILDIMMPGMDGFSMLEKIPIDRRIPTIILSARDQEYDKLNGFELGVDDYLTKPFSPKELMARIHAVLKRCSNIQTNIYEYETLELNHSAHTLKIDNKLVNITPKEYQIISYLINNKNIAISREQLLNQIWGYDFFGDDRTVDTHIKMLRNNLGRYRDLIVTVHGLGYKFVDEKE